MKLTKTNVRKYAAETSSGLEKDVCKYILSEWDNYEDKTYIFKDVLNHGCQTGIVGHLIYYSDIAKYYKKHCAEISEMLSDFAIRSPSDLFSGRWDEDDPLATEGHNQSLLAWFGFEEAMSYVAEKFEVDY